MYRVSILVAITSYILLAPALMANTPSADGADPAVARTLNGDVTATLDVDQIDSIFTTASWWRQAGNDNHGQIQTAHDAACHRTASCCTLADLARNDRQSRQICHEWHSRRKPPRNPNPGGPDPDNPNSRIYRNEDVGGGPEADECEKYQGWEYLACLANKQPHH